MISILELAAIDVVAVPAKLVNDEIVLAEAVLFTMVYLRLVVLAEDGKVIDAVPVKYQTDAVLSSVTAVEPA